MTPRTENEAGSRWAVSVVGRVPRRSSVRRSGRGSDKLRRTNWRLPHTWVHVLATTDTVTHSAHTGSVERVVMASDTVALLAPYELQVRVFVGKWQSLQTCVDRIS